MKKAFFSIAAVERETKISKENLRIWEKRYGFPNPQRDRSGDRVYTAHQVEQLQLIKLLIDQGRKPKELLGASLPRLKAHIENTLGQGESPFTPEEEHLIRVIKTYSPREIQVYLHQKFEELHTDRFLNQFIPHFLQIVGQAWARGRVNIEEEHSFSECLMQFLRELAPRDPTKPKGPKVLLSTPVDEHHQMGMLMALILLRKYGCSVVNLGVNLPVQQMLEGLRRHQAQVIAISFSIAYSLSEARLIVKDLLQQLEGEQELWVGGALAARLASGEFVAKRRSNGPSELVPNLHFFSSFQDVKQHLELAHYKKNE